MKNSNPHCPNFIDKKDNHFKSLHRSIDSHFYNLHSNDIGWHMKHAKAISKEDEQKLWQSGVMGTTTPRLLQNAAFFVVGKMFCLGGGKELCALKFSQVVTQKS